MLSVSLMFIGFALLALPGVLAWRRIFPDDSSEECLALGGAMGIAVAVYLAYVTAIVSTAWFWGIWGVLSIAILIVCRRSILRILDLRLSLALVLFAVAATQFVAVAIRSLPGGFDPSFHCLLAKKILLTGKLIHDWEPFAPVTLNYPLGCHLLLVQFARFSGLPIHVVFKLLIPTFSVLTTLGIYTLALRAFRSREIALYASIAYGLWMFTGNAAYLVWGGLPNQIAMVFVVAMLTLIVREQQLPALALLVGVFIAAICLTHHHVMLVAGALLATSFAYFVLRSDVYKRQWMVLKSVVVAGVVAAFFLIPYVAKILTLTKTEVLRYYEPPVGIYTLSDTGAAVIVFGILGIVIGFRKKEDESAMSLLLIVCGTLLTLFVICDPLYRLISYLRFHQTYVAFTPSRFLNDLNYLLVIFAGYALHWLQRQTNRRTTQVTIFAFLLGLTNLPQWLTLPSDKVSKGRWQAYEWIAANTPPNSIVATKEPWAAYATWRRTLQAPLPISEPQQHIQPIAALATGAPAYAIEQSPNSEGDLVRIDKDDPPTLDPSGHPLKRTVEWMSPDRWTVSKLSIP